ncbi:hypothetical protein Hanom_Chr14g01307431 [Helianthus anomalus]
MGRLLKWNLGMLRCKQIDSGVPKVLDQINYHETHGVGTNGVRLISKKDL